MPKLEPKQIQKELETGQIWPVYWIYGQERMKARELVKRIKLAVLGSPATGAAAEIENRSLSAFHEEVLDAGEASAAQIVDAAQSLTLGGGTRVITIRDAHQIKEMDQLAALLGPRTKKEELSSVCIFLSKDLDGRKKFSKLLTEQAAVVPCEEIPEEERDAWISYLAKRKGLELPSFLVLQLRSLDPWNLDIVDQELTKYEFTQDPLVVQGASHDAGGAERFLEAFMMRAHAPALQSVEAFAERPDESLPLLGLLCWNVRFLSLLAKDQQQGTRNTKISPFLAERFQRWTRKWKLEEVIELQRALNELDFELKQTPRIALGSWTSLVNNFCRSTPAS